MPAERGHKLQMSLEKARCAPACTHGLMISYVAVKDHVIPRAWLDCKAKLLAKFARADCEQMITNLR